MNPSTPITVFTLFHQTTNTAIAQVSLPMLDGLILGRSDMHSDYIPDLDLSAWEARDHGVSRRHAAFITHQGWLHVLDLASINGTFVNSRRLRVETPQRLNSGDQLRLGTLNLMVR